MPSNNKKCILSFFLALVVIGTCIPTQAFASEVQQAEGKETVSSAVVMESQDPDPISLDTTAETLSTETIQVSEEEKAQSKASDEIQARIRAILTQYGVTTPSTDSEIMNTIAAADGDAQKATLDEIQAIEKAALELSEEEFLTMDKETLDAYSNFLSVMERLTTPAIITEVTVLDGQISVTDTANSSTVSNDTVTIKATGSLFSKSTNTVTVTNETPNTATLAFDYSASTYNSFTIDGTAASASGGVSKLLESGKSVTLVLTSNSGLSNRTATLTLSNFSLTAAAANSKVTFEFDSALGSITVGGTAVTAENKTQEISLSSGAALVATPNSGVSFLGWIDETGKVLSTAASYTLIPATDMTVEATFADSTNGWFSVLDGADTYLFNNLNTAATFAASASSKTTVLAANGTLVSGTYTIPSGVTLLIPFDDANTTYTNNHKDAGGIAEGGRSTYSSIYRTLTMKNGANIVVNGTMSLPAKINAPAGGKSNAGAPTGAVPMVKMESGSNITVNNGGKLYCYGFITGSGSVTANSGATVNECFQFRDYRGGSGCSDIENVFPLSQYYVQNIEVPLTVNTGASVKCVTAVTVSIVGIQYMEVPFIGAGSMFSNSGTVVKRYDGTTDRLIIDINGNMTVGSISLKIGSVGLNMTINSYDYVLALNNNMTVNINSGTTTVGSSDTAQKLALLPGVELNIAENAGLTLNTGSHLYVYDSDDWGPYTYAESITDGVGTNSSSINHKFIPVGKAPGKTYTRTEADLKDAKITVNGTLTATAANIYTTAGGADIISTNAGQIVITVGTETITQQVTMTSGSELTYYDIGITPAKLKNANGSYVETTVHGGGTYTYDSTDGLWHKWGEGDPTAPTCTEPGYITYPCACGGSHKIDAEPATGHSWIANKCGNCGLIRIHGTNLRAGASLDLYFYVDVANAPDKDAYKAVITRFRQGTQQTPEEIPGSQWTAYGADYYRFCYDGIAAKEMTDSVQVAIYKDNERVSTYYTESIRDYAMRSLTYYTGDAHAKLRTTLVDMLNYGTAAQSYFAYNTTDPANSQLTDAQKEYATQSVDCENNAVIPDGVTCYDSVTTESSLTLTFYFPEMLNGKTVTVSYKDHYGTPVTHTFTDSEFTTREIPEDGSTVYGAPVSGLAIADGRQLITCTVDGVSVSSSIESYVSRNTGDVYTCLMKFVDSAYAYFHKDDPA